MSTFLSSDGLDCLNYKVVNCHALIRKIGGWQGLRNHKIMEVDVQDCTSAFGRNRTWLAAFLRFASLWFHTFLHSPLLSDDASKFLCLLQRRMTTVIREIFVFKNSRNKFSFFKNFRRMRIAYEFFLTSDFFHTCVAASIILTLKILGNRHTCWKNFALENILSLA